MSGESKKSRTDTRKRPGAETGLVWGVVIGILLAILTEKIAWGILVGGILGLILFSRSRDRD